MEQQQRGLPSWGGARAGEASARPATQASIGVSADGRRWFLINAAPDLREQIQRRPQLHPTEGLRSSPIAGVVLTNGDVDAVAGLLHLRERTPFRIYAHARILRVLDANPIFKILAPDLVTREILSIGTTTALRGPDGVDSGLRLTPFAVPGKVALYMEAAGDRENFGTREGDTIGVEITREGHAGRLVFVGNCAAADGAVKARCAGADVLFFDGTLWRDDEMVTRGEGVKTGQRMGHISMSGPEGSMAALADLDIGRRIFIHINNTNPALLSDSPERAELEAAGWQVAEDGMEIAVP